MPHLTLEHSSNLATANDMQSLCVLLNKTLFDSGLFELGAIRVRAVSCEAYAIADGLPQNSFLDANLRIGAGRTPDEKQRVGEELFTALIDFFQLQLAELHFALSLEVREIDAKLSWKKNAIHPRLR